jgi:hypothetical protein
VEVDVVVEVDIGVGIGMGMGMGMGMRISEVSLLQPTKIIINSCITMVMVTVTSTELVIL